MEESLKDYYRILGVGTDADAKKIKAAYRKLARENHPDTKQAHDKAEAEERIKEINEAYDVLGDTKKRAEYDQLREAMRHPQRRHAAGAGNRQGYGDFSGGAPFASGSPFGNGAPFGGGFASDDDGSWRWEGGNLDAETLRDLLGGFFGRTATAEGRPGKSSFGIGGQDPRTVPVAGSDVESEIVLPLLDAFRGTRRKIRLSIGSALDGATGRNPAAQRSKERTLEITIPSGVRDGSVIRIAGQGSPGSGGAPAGELLLTVRIQPDERFTLIEDDVETTLALRPEQAALGCQTPVQTLDGTVRLTVPPHSRAGHRLRLAGKGWPKRNGSRGDLLVRIRIDLPDKLTARELALYKQLAQLREDDFTHRPA